MAEDTKILIWFWRTITQPSLKPFITHIWQTKDKAPNHNNYLGFVNTKWDNETSESLNSLKLSRNNCKQAHICSQNKSHFWKVDLPLICIIIMRLFKYVSGSAIKQENSGIYIWMQFMTKYCSSRISTLDILQFLIEIEKSSVILQLSEPE